MTRLNSAYLDMTSSLRKIGTVIVISAPGGALLYTYLHFSETGGLPSGQDFAGFFASSIIGRLTGVVLYFTNVGLDRWIPWRSFFASRFGLGLIVNYLIAVLFVIFDVETVFLFPWAVLFDQLALFGFIEMMIFLVILVIGYVYVWNRGALRWV